MPTYQTKGIVIGRTNFGEADRIIRFLTPDHGKVSAVARGVRRIKSRSGGHLELFGEVNLMLATGRNLDVVTSARLSWYPHNLTGAYDRLGLAFALATATDRSTQAEQPQPQLYEVLLEALHVIDAGATGALPELWFKLRLLEILGYRPELGACIDCGTHDPQMAYLFSAERGGIVCQTDSDVTASPMSSEAIKLWRLLSDYSYATIAQINHGPELARATIDLCDSFYVYHLGKAFHPTLSGNIT